MDTSQWHQEVGHAYNELGKLLLDELSQNDALTAWTEEQFQDQKQCACLHFLQALTNFKALNDNINQAVIFCNLAKVMRIAYARSRLFSVAAKKEAGCIRSTSDSQHTHSPCQKFHHPQTDSNSKVPLSHSSSSCIDDASAMTTSTTSQIAKPNNQSTDSLWQTTLLGDMTRELADLDRTSFLTASDPSLQHESKTCPGVCHVVASTADRNLHVNAISYYQNAQQCLGYRSSHPQLWDQIQFELAGARVGFAALLASSPPEERKHVQIEEYLSTAISMLAELKKSLTIYEATSKQQQQQPWSSSLKKSVTLKLAEAHHRLGLLHRQYVFLYHNMPWQAYKVAANHLNKAHSLYSIYQYETQSLSLQVQYERASLCSARRGWGSEVKISYQTLQQNLRELLACKQAVVDCFLFPSRQLSRGKKKNCVHSQQSRHPARKFNRRENDFIRDYGNVPNESDSVPFVFRENLSSSDRVQIAQVCTGICAQLVNIVRQMKDAISRQRQPNKKSKPKRSLKSLIDLILEKSVALQNSHFTRIDKIEQLLDLFERCNYLV